MPALPDWIGYDVRVLEQHEDVLLSSINILEQSVDVCFDIHFPHYPQAHEKRIHNPEKITLSYTKTEVRDAPDVLAIRDDFPRHLPHLNPTKVTSPVSICLWRKGGTKALYMQKGIESLVTVLQEWLVDASLGDLNTDGWEPSPRTSCASLVTNAPKLQEMICNPKNAGMLLKLDTKVFFNRFKGVLFGVSANKADVNLKNINSYINARKSGQCVTQQVSIKGKQLEHLNTFVIVPNHRCVNDINDSSEIESLADLKAFACDDTFNNFIEIVESEFSRFNEERAAIVVIAKRRPKAMISEIMGLSKDEEYRKVELLPFLIHYRRRKTHVDFLSLRSRMKPEELAQISGVEPNEGSLGFIGAGALGSAISDQLARSGIYKIKQWDGDSIELHNSARHVCIDSTFETPVLSTKARMVVDRLKQLSEDHRKEIEGFDKHFKIQNERTACSKLDLLVDTTGSDLMGSWQERPSCAVTRVYVSDSGRIGVIQCQQSNGEGADILDLDAYLILSASWVEALRDWLIRDASLEAKLVGLSCSSETLALPWSSVLNHASTFVPLIRKQMSQPTAMLGINVLDDDGLPRGYVPVAQQDELSFEAQKVADVDGVEWYITIHSSVIEKCDKITREYSPKEAGGYLCGLVNMELNRISIVFASKGTFTSTPTGLTLEPLDKDSECNALMNSCNEMLLPLGTWHSHPHSTSKESSTDSRTLEEITKQKQPLPFVMLIKGTDGINLKVGYNRNFD
ncbi:ThiF family adenylyltransferase [Photobacterium damselae]|uniref:ThiF family adenylyltransferase n=1 Tax=Photobacterium damselae TaxID=38293 RepID=UPI004067791C